MKNKKSLYILIPLVLIIWGTILWKTFWISGDKIKDVSSDDQLMKPVIEKKSEEKRSLLLNYNDPFILFLEETKTIEIETDEAENNVSNRVPMWPEIKYYGLVKNSKCDVSLALLEISNTRHFARIGGKFEEVVCFFIHKDSIGLEFQNDKKYFLRNEMINYNY